MSKNDFKINLKKIKNNGGENIKLKESFKIMLFNKKKNLVLKTTFYLSLRYNLLTISI